jgi:hypothetical protein
MLLLFIMGTFVNFLIIAYIIIYKVVNSNENT